MLYTLKIWICVIVEGRKCVLKVIDVLCMCVSSAQGMSQKSYQVLLECDDLKLGVVMEQKPVAQQ
jgi:hypothetical protein